MQETFSCIEQIKAGGPANGSPAFICGVFIQVLLST